MSGTGRKFELISETDAPAPAASTEQSRLAALNTHMMLLALRALSQRALTAVSNLFTLGLVASVWWLISGTLPNPTPMQLTGIAGYAVFCVVVDVVRRRL
jgi:hypothetical protein